MREALETSSMTVHAKRVAQRKRNSAAGVMGYLGGELKGGLRLVTIEEIALEVQDLARSDNVVVDIFGAKEQEADCPRKVFMVRWPSSVTKMRQEPVAGPVSAGGFVNPTPTELMS